MCKKSLLILFSTVFCLTLLLSLSVPQNIAAADMGPKPSVNIELNCIDDGEEYYATLLSQNPLNGPYIAFEKMKSDYEEEKTKGNYEEYDSFDDFFLDSFGTEEDLNILNLLSEFDDPDNFYLIDWYRKCSGSTTLYFGYYPPSTFKVLLYFVRENKFVVSQICEQYAFSNYYKMDVNINEIIASGTTEPISVSKNYNYTREILLLIARIIITIVIELALALSFKYRTKKALVCIGVTNLFTQIILNVLLNIKKYKQGWLAFVFTYLGVELIACIIESITYAFCAKKYVFGEENKSVGKAIGYAIVANVISFGVGFMFAMFVS